jgi:hypothetical protein
MTDFTWDEWTSLGIACALTAWAGSQMTWNVVLALLGSM